MTASDPAFVPALAMAFAGVAVGLIYFAALQRTVAQFAAGRGWAGPVTLTLGRIGGVVVFLAAAAKFGALALIAAFLGFLLARAIALRAARRVN